MTPIALWSLGSGEAKLQEAREGDGVLVRMLFSGISRGTERLVFEGRVPASQHESMRCSGQEGQFNFPIKYGYCAVGEVQEGELKGKKVFTLHPHQDQFRVSMDMLHVLPMELPVERAVLAANMETALNVVWDSEVALGDRVLVIGAGVVGTLVAYLISHIPGVDLTLVDQNPSREKVAASLGIRFALPANAPLDCDVVIHATGSEAGLNLAIVSGGNQARIVEASWYGEGSQSVSLGGAFHDRRLTLISSQVGSIPASKAPRWTYRRRMSKALEMLQDSKLDVLISGESSFEDLARDYPAILASPETLCHRVRYQ